MSGETQTQAETEKGGLGGLLGGLGGMLSSLMPFILGLLGLFFVIKKFMPDSFISKLLPDLPSFGGDDKAKDKTPETDPAKLPVQARSVDLRKLIESYADTSHNGTVNAKEEDAFNAKIAKVVKGGGRMSDNEMNAAKMQLLIHDTEIKQTVSAGLKNGKLTDEGFNAVAQQVAAYLHPTQARGAAKQ